MDEVNNLISVLKTEEDLYNNLYDLLKEELDAITGWQIDRVIEIGKKKNIIYCKERLLEEARKNFLEKIGRIYNKNQLKINDLIELIEDMEYKENLTNLRKNLLNILEKIQIANTKIKILYKNNIKIINEFFGDIGVKECPTYAKNKRINTLDNFTFIKNI